MNNRDEKKPLEIGNSAGPLRRLIRSQRLYEALNERIQPLLPEAARGRIQVACVDDSCLVLACASSAWASRARMESTRVLETARALWPEDLREVKIIVSPAVTTKIGGF